MSTRIILRSPSGVELTRDIVNGQWEEPTGDSDIIIGDDLWALPGLVDAHAHLATRELGTEPGNLPEAIERARAALLAGVTLILDKGWRDDTTIQLVSRLDPGERPEIEAAARVIATDGGYYAGFGRIIEPTDVGLAAGDEGQRGRGWVKLIGDWPRKGVGPVANFDETQLRSAVESAAAVGARVAIHTMAREVPTMAVAAGVHSIEHGLFLTESDLGDLGSRSGMWVPTLLRSEATMTQLGPASSGGRLFEEALARVGRLLPLAVEAGVNVLAGTDLVGSPADVAAEAIRLAEYGLTPSQVVDAISTSAFKAVERDHGFEIGTPADAVLFAGNPLDDLSVLGHPAHVIRQGRLL